MKTSRDKILILNVEASNVLPFTWYYRKRGYIVIGGSNLTIPSTFFSKSLAYRIYIPYSNIGKIEVQERGKERIFISKIKKVREKYGISLVLSFYENTTKPLIKYKKELKIKDVYPSYKSYLTLYDKKILKKHLESENFKSFYVPKSYGKIIKFPCIVKPNIGGGGEYVRICTNFSELKKYSRMIRLARRKPIIEEYIPFQDIISMNLLIDKKFEIKRVLVREVVSRNKLINAINELEEFFKKIKYFGLASPQFLIKDGKLYLIEINPRLSYHPFGIDFGVNFPKSFHEAIIENNEVVKKFIFLPRNYPKGNIWHLLRIYRTKYEDILPIGIESLRYLKWKIEDRIKSLVSIEYKKWLNIFSFSS
jgi:predicted ATP-grasp superfamily ATP-dependent carboligase